MNSLPNVIISHIKVQEGTAPVVQDNETHQKNVAELASSYASKFDIIHYTKKALRRGPVEIILFGI